MGLGRSSVALARPDQHPRPICPCLRIPRPVDVYENARPKPSVSVLQVRVLLGCLSVGESSKAEDLSPLLRVISCASLRPTSCQTVALVRTPRLSAILLRLLGQAVKSHVWVVEGSHEDRGQGELSFPPSRTSPRADLDFPRPALCLV